MLKHIEEFGNYVEITGFKKVKFRNPEEFLKTVDNEKPPGVDVQFFDARFIASWQHLYFAALNALKAFQNKENISNSPAMEALLYAAAERQIAKAVKLVGIRPDTLDVAVLIIGKESRIVKLAFSVISKKIGGEHDEKVLDLSKQKAAMIQKSFDISEAELETVMEKDESEKALIDLVIERMALLVTQR